MCALMLENARGQVLNTDGKGYILMGSEVGGHRSVEVLFCHFALRTKEDLDLGTASDLVSEVCFCS